MPGVEHDQAERLDPRLAGAGARSFPRAVDVQDQPEGIVQGGGLDVGGRPFQHDAQEGIGAHRLEANLLHQAVVDHLDARAGEQRRARRTRTSSRPETIAYARVPPVSTTIRVKDG